jgi:guanylate kinase
MVDHIVLGVESSIKRIILVGKGGSGKDHLRKILENEGLNYCVSHTTRPIREGEQEGKDYFFVSGPIFLGMIEGGYLYENVIFNTWYYGISREQFKKGDLLIMTPNGVSALTKGDRKSSVVIYIDIDEDTRRQRMSIRRDSDQTERRLKADFLDFENFTDFDLRITDPSFTIETFYSLLKSK